MSRRLLRIALNLVTALVLLLSTGSLAMWFRSRYRDDAWVSEPRLTKTPLVLWMPSGPWELHRRFGSTHGRLVWVASEESYGGGPEYFMRRSPSGWVVHPVPASLLDRSTYLTKPFPAGTVHGAVPGLAEWAVVPPHNVGNWALGRVGRVRYVSVSWLIPAVAGLIVAPKAISTVRRIRRSKALRLKLCPYCGYDLRATPDRCPECGTVPTLQ